MNKVLTMRQIEKRYDGEWVLLDDLVNGKAGELRGGTVLAHSKDRDEVHRKALELRPKHFALWFVGRVSGNFALNL